MAARSDLVMATGRSDFPNQVNNVLGFPFIFRGALDARAKEITEAMLIAAVHALAELAREPVPASVLKAYKLKKLVFGPDYILPKPFDPRLAERVPQAVAKAAKPGKSALSQLQTRNLNRAVKPIARPVYLNLFRIHLPLAGWVSILHRVSGALLFLALPLRGVGLVGVLDRRSRFPAHGGLADASAGQAACAAVDRGVCPSSCSPVCGTWRSMRTGA